MKYLYVILMEDKNNLNSGVIQRHVEHLRDLDESGKLVLCGPFTDYAGGMVILNVPSFEEAEIIAKKDHFISEGYKTYHLRTLECAAHDNNFLLQQFRDS